MYILLLLSIFLAGANNVFLHLLSQKKIRYDLFLFNAALSAVWVIVLFSYNLGWHGGDVETLVYGFVYGITLTGFIFFKSLAMSTGPIALSALFGCSSFVLTTVFNAIYWKDRVSFFDVAGIVLMLAAVLMISVQPRLKEKEKEKKTSVRWFVYCVLFFLFSASVGIIFRMHQSTDVENTNEMMILASVVATLLLLIIFFTKRFLRKKKFAASETEGAGMEGTNLERKKRRLVFFVALGCGVSGCVYNRLNIYNSGALPSTLFFPIFNGGVIMVSFLTGWLLFKEKPSKLQFFGMLVGALAILTVSRFFGLL